MNFEQLLEFLGNNDMNFLAISGIVITIIDIILTYLTRPDKSKYLFNPFKISNRIKSKYWSVTIKGYIATIVIFIVIQFLVKNWGAIMFVIACITVAFLYHIIPVFIKAYDDYKKDNEK